MHMKLSTLENIKSNWLKILCLEIVYLFLINRILCRKINLLSPNNFKENNDWTLKNFFSFLKLFSPCNM